MEPSTIAIVLTAGTLLVQVGRWVGARGESERRIEELCDRLEALEVSARDHGERLHRAMTSIAVLESRAQWGRES